jgi:hypothetical protein
MLLLLLLLQEKAHEAQRLPQELILNVYCCMCSAC